jgi:hypothetical protein
MTDLQGFTKVGHMQPTYCHLRHLWRRTFLDEPLHHHLWEAWSAAPVAVLLRFPLYALGLV